MALDRRKTGEGSNGNQDLLKLGQPVKSEVVCKVENPCTPDDCKNELGDSEDNEDPVDNSTENSDISVLSAPESKHSELVECHRCNRKYKNKRSLSTHVRVKHKVALINRAKMPCLEKNCDFRGSRIAGLISHLIRAHKRKFQCEKVTFQGQEEFWNWKKKAEDRCRSSYSAITSARELASGDRKFFLRCNRSGYAKTDLNFSASSTNKRSSMKINAVCTSFMDVNFLKEGGTIVHFCRTHYGHKEDVAYTRMNDDERGIIKDLIVEGLTASEIIAAMKTRLPAHRHHLLKYANIRNISVRQNLFMRKSKGLSSKNESDMDKDTFDQSMKSWDIAMDLKVDNEVEIEAGHILEPEISLSTINNQDQNFDMTGNVGSCTIEQLKSEVADKAQKISKLALGLVTEISLNALNKKLDSILNDIGQDEHIEVIPDCMESTESCKQMSCMFEDIRGNSVSLLCSDKDVHELSDKNNQAINVP